MKDLTIGFIGLGLIGGSIARGIKRSRRDVRIMAYMRSRDKLEQAKRDGVVDVILDGIGEEISWCDLVFLCTPVEYNASYLEQIRPLLKPGALVTDVGSTKTDIHETVKRRGVGGGLRGREALRVRRPVRPAGRGEVYFYGRPSHGRIRKDRL